MSTEAITVRYLTTTRIGEKGQITVPKRFRQELRLEAGSPFTVLRVGDGLILLPEQQRFELLCQRLGSLLSGSGLKSEEILATLPEARKRVFDRRYGRANRASQPHRGRLRK